MTRLEKSGSPDILLLTDMVEHPYLRQRSYILHKGEILSPLEVHNEEGIIRTRYKAMSAKRNTEGHNRGKQTLMN